MDFRESNSELKSKAKISLKLKTQKKVPLYSYNPCTQEAEAGRLKNSKASLCSTASPCFNQPIYRSIPQKKTSKMNKPNKDLWVTLTMTISYR